MPISKNKKIFIYFFLFLLIGSLNNKNLNDKKFVNISKIKIEGMDKKDNIKLLNDLKFLKIKNLFFLKKSSLVEIIDSNSLVEEFSIFKQYPSTLIVRISQTKFLAQIRKNENNFLLGSNGKLTRSKNFDKDLPFIFGEFDNQNFFKLKNAIDDSEFDYNQIKNLFFFKSGRWDIETKNGLLVKLPKEDIKKSLELFINFYDKIKEKEINEIDLRQNKQIIING